MSLESRITVELNQHVTLHEVGKRWAVAKREAIVLQVVKKALGGDARALEFLLAHLPKEPRRAYEIRCR